MLKKNRRLFIKGRSKYSNVYKMVEYPSLEESKAGVDAALSALGWVTRWGLVTGWAQSWRSFLASMVLHTESLIFKPLKHLPI